MYGPLPQLDRHITGTAGHVEDPQWTPGDLNRYVANRWPKYGTGAANAIHTLQPAQCLPMRFLVQARQVHEFRLLAPGLQARQQWAHAYIIVHPRTDVVMRY